MKKLYEELSYLTERFANNKFYIVDNAFNMLKGPFEYSYDAESALIYAPAGAKVMSGEIINFELNNQDLDLGESKQLNERIDGVGVYNIYNSVNALKIKANTTAGISITILRAFDNLLEEINDVLILADETEK